MILRTGFGVTAGLVGTLSIALALAAAPPTVPGSTDEPTEVPVAKAVSVETARDRAQLLHEVYAATLEVMHQRYFRANRATLPARALEDVFAEIDRQSRVKTGWIAVNTRAMSVNHEAKTDFERKAAAALSAGKTEYERVENGVYQRAGLIPLGAGCVGCHVGFGGPEVKTPRFAGLVITIPVVEK